MNSELNNITFVLGFWYHEKNKKHDLEHYLKYIPLTLTMLKDCKIVFYYEQDFILNFVKQHIQTKNFKAIKLKNCELPTYQISENFLNSCICQDNKALLSDKKIKNIKTEKGYVHYEREYLQSGPHAYKHIISVWTSKIFLMNDYNYHDTEYVAWVDVSLARFNFIKNQSSLKLFKLQPHRFYGYTYKMSGHQMSFYGEDIIMIACFMCCSKKFLQQKFLPLYTKQLHLCKDSNYAHDEETILHCVLKENPTLFKY